MSDYLAQLLGENKITGDQYVTLQLAHAEVEKTKSEVEKEKVKTELEKTKENADVEKTKAKAEVVKKFADVKIAQIQILGRAVSSLNNPVSQIQILGRAVSSLNNPVYEESEYSETKYERAILPFGDPKVKKQVKREDKRVDPNWMQHKEKMAAGIMQMIAENKRDTFQGNNINRL